MDELAFKLRIDPIAFRLRNYAETDPEKNRPWSSKSLRECYRIGADLSDGICDKCSPGLRKLVIT